ncbi:MAG: hypothetical protein IKX18_05550 [Muribaculaceae bacterium]|nr:hypothetical protein [Muribaculaceae bacterium]
MRQITALIFASLLALTAVAQDLPQFAYNDFDGWTYSGCPLTEDLISGGVYLYVASTGEVYTLTSPTFPCQNIDTIAALVRWKSNDINIGLTTVLEDGQGNPIDSATCFPSSSSSNQKLTFRIAVPPGLENVRLRLVSWEAVVSNSGAVRAIELTAITSPHENPLGDVNHDGNIDISDATALINYLLNGDASGIDLTAADTTGDGSVDISDATTLINYLLNGHY